MKEAENRKCFQNIDLHFKYKLKSDFSILPRAVPACGFFLTALQKKLSTGMKVLKAVASTE